MKKQLFQVDAFTDTPFSGNPAAVCHLEGPANDEWMQKVAGEMNLSETAFVYPAVNGYSLRWFTPKCEVNLCGHGTLATAATLWEIGFVAKDETITFDTKSGILKATLSEGQWIKLDFPSVPIIETTAPEHLEDALGVSWDYCAKTETDYLLVLDSEDAVRDMAPDFNRLLNITSLGIFVTSKSDTPDYDFVSRVFAPAEGINEDPVTGSAHCVIGPYWKEKLNKSEFMAYQASERSGILRVNVEKERVFLYGQARMIFAGELLV